MLLIENGVVNKNKNIKEIERVELLFQHIGKWYVPSLRQDLHMSGCLTNKQNKPKFINISPSSAILFLRLFSFIFTNNLRIISTPNYCGTFCELKIKCIKVVPRMTATFFLLAD
jgi:hypothetical protein